MRIPRPYQSEAVSLLRSSFGTGKRTPILQLPTGAGKTFIASMIARMALAKNNRVLFLAPRRELIFQTSKAFSEEGIHNGMIMAGVRPEHANVQIASKDTINARAIKNDHMPMPDADLIIVDEAHLSITDTYSKILEHYAGKLIIGLTATPARGDGRGLNEFYDELICPVSIKQLTDDGYLSPVRYFAPTEPDLRGLKVQGGDYAKDDLGKVMDKPELVGDIVKNWKRLASGKSTVVFCSTMAHGRHVCEEFNAEGIKAEHIDSDTPKEERSGIIERVASGETTVVTNVFVMSYGIDIPSLECAVLARPTKNITLYLQTVGRVLRTFEGKEHALVIDHSGAVKENGFVDEEQYWSLDGEDTVKERKKEAQEAAKEPKEITCGECGSVFKSRKACPVCGFQAVKESEPIPVHEANLQEIKRAEIAEGKKANRVDAWDMKVDFMGQLKAYAASKGYKSGWVAHKYKSKYGVWPNDPRVNHAQLTNIGSEVMGWIKHEAIARRAAA